MTYRIELNGSDWLMKDFIGEDWIWRHAEKPDTKDVRWWRKGTVPGTVLHDLWRNGETPDPLFERNSLLVEWVPQRTWIYKKTFTVEETLRGRRIQLCFEGIDYEALVYLNGKLLGSHTGMFTPAAFEVSEELQYGGDNLLAVVIQKAPDEQPQVSKTEYVRTHKSRMTYWWDFCPRMIHQGIWDAVFLEVTGPVRIEDVYVRPQLTADREAAELSVSTALSAVSALTVQVETLIRFRGEPVASARTWHAVAIGTTCLNTRIELARPRLWWPGGSAHGEEGDDGSAGDAALYEAEISVKVVRPEEDDIPEETLSAVRTIAFGIRDVRFEANDSPDGTARPYTLVVNGRRIYIKGWNWVPLDVMYGVPRSGKLERLLRLARRAGVNMLRVWGGGLIERESFYELCDRYGIMVWQEFIQSSSGIANRPSAAPEFLEMMAGEAEAIIPRKRNHPSLVLWCGGNELTGPGDVPLDDDEPVLCVLKEAVERLHPGALWLPTSPSGRLFMNSLKNADEDPDGMHDVHGPWEHQGLTGQYELYNRAASLLHSEFGVEGMTNRRALDATIHPSHQWPPSKDNPVYFHRGAWWINEPLVQGAFGGRIQDIDTMIRASQSLQAEGLRYAIEANRRRQGQNSGSLPWQFNEPYPNAYCTSAIDYYAHPKPAYYAVARAYRSVSVTARFAKQAWAGEPAFAAELWAVSDEPAPQEGWEAAWSIAGSDGTVYAEGRKACRPAAGKPIRVGMVGFELAQLREELFFLSVDLTDASGVLVADNRYTFSRTDDLQPLLDLPIAAVAITRRETGSTSWCLELSHAGGPAAVELRLEEERPLEAEGYAYFSDNGFSLLPGESRTVAVEWSGVPPVSRRLSLSGWNTGVVQVR
ncbi:glycosyl hydrolase 2 galactose-binding domain-containing protein [Paenibacillus sp. HJGM_3]|uniref:glycoside hydrolase family 2 protein n=1 Tax=Paenibacillus sp. HJGM_3 TaxID=3379816 RepID=UPI00385E3D9D